MKKLYFGILLLSLSVGITANLKAQWTRIPLTETLYQKPLRTDKIVECNNNLFALVWSVGLYCSTNEGISWNQLNNVNVHNLYRIFSVNNILFLDYLDHVVRSTDNGNTWDNIDSEFLFHYTYKTSMDKNKVNINDFTSISEDLFVATDAGIYRSQNQGISWSLRSNGLPNN
jgi:hypothetical protein